MSWILRHAVLPPAIAYAIAMAVLVAGSRSRPQPRSRGPRRPLGRAAGALLTLGLGGFGAFAVIVGAYCAAQTRPARCLTPALREAGRLCVIALAGLLVLEVLSRLAAARKPLDRPDPRS